MKSERFLSAVHRHLLLWASILLLAWVSPASGGEASTPRASKREVSVAIVKDGLPPLLIVRDDQLSGVAFDILRAVLGNDVTYKVRTYRDLPSLSEAACAGSFDIMLVMHGPAVNTGCLLTTDPYYDANTVVIGRTGDQTTDGVFRPGARIAIDAGSYAEIASRERYPDASFLRVSNATEGLRAAASSSADYYVTLQPVAEYELSQAEFTGLSEVARYRDTSSSVSFAVSSSAGALRGSLNAGLANLSPDARAGILARWVTTGRIRQAHGLPFVLSLSERAYLRSLPALRVNLDPGLAPYSYMDESGEPKGMAVDYLEYLGEILGISFSRQTAHTFGAAIEALRKGNLDAIAVVEPSDPALAGLPASRPYAVFPIAIVGKQSAPTVGRLSDLKDAHIAATEGGGVRALLLRVLPRARIVVVPDIRSGMDAVKRGEADAYVDDLAATNFELLRNYGDSLRIIGSDAIQVTTAFAFRPDLADRLLPLVNRALAAISDQDRLAIQNRYITAKYSFGLSLGSALLRAAPLLLGLLCIVAILLRSRHLLRKEAAVRRVAERRLQEITGSIPAIVYEYRLLRHRTEEREFTYAAGNGEHTLGVAPRDLLNHTYTFEDLVDPNYHTLVRSKLEQAYNPELPADFDCLIHGRLGPRWARIRAVARIEGDAMIWTGVISDVTDQHKQAEALSKAQANAEAALRAKESFLAMMSHEIRTPLNGVLGLLEVLQATTLNKEQQRILSLVVESGQSLAQILDDVLDYAKMEAGQLAILPSPTDLRDLADSVLGLLAPQAHHKGIQLSVHVAAHVPATIEADSIRLRQILLNLLGNAIKFTDRGQVILRIFTETTCDDDAALVIEVSDTGIGISAENLQRLFAPFVQSEHSSTRRYGGTGLGLSICKRLAGLMSAKLVMRSELGEGTTVTLRITCPVLCAAYNLPAFKGRAVVLDIKDSAVAASMRAYAETVGLTLLERPPASGTTYSYLYDGERMPAVPPTCAIQVTSTPNQMGFSIVGDTVRLSQNPLRWSAFLGAIKESMGVTESRASSSTMPVDKQPGQPPSTTTTHKHLRILVAEDHPINRELIRQQLDLLGYQSFLCKDGQEALQALLRDGYDLVLTDCHMPVTDGFDLARGIRASKDDRVRHLPIVGVTATTLAEEHHRCFDVGMNECVLKPTTLATLQKALDRALASTPGIGWAIVTGEAFGPSETKDVGLSFDAAHLSRETLLRGLGDGIWSDAMLATCRDSIVADRENLSRELQEGADLSIDRLREWCHRAGGAMALFRDPYINQLFDEFSAIVKRGEESQIRAAGAPMLAMLSQLASEISPLSERSLSQ